MEFEGSLLEYINGGVYDQPDLCYKFVAEIKWSDGFICKGKCSRENKTSTSFYELKIATLHNAPYSRRCTTCGDVESPTKWTSLENMALPSFVEFVYWLVHQRRCMRRLSNKEIMNNMNGVSTAPDKEFSKELEAFNLILKDSKLSLTYQKKVNEINPIGESAVEEYRYFLQQFIIDWTHGRSFVRAPYGIIKFEIKRGSCVKTIYVARQLCPNGHIRAKVYDADTDESLLSFLKFAVPKAREVFLYGWDHIDEKIKKRWGVQIGSNELLDSRWLEGHETQLKRWLQGLDIKDNNRVQLHLNECIFILNYEYLDTALLLTLLVGIPIGFARRLRAKR